MFCDRCNVKLALRKIGAAGKQAGANHSESIRTKGDVRYVFVTLETHIYSSISEHSHRDKQKCKRFKTPWQLKAIKEAAKVIIV